MTQTSLTHNNGQKINTLPLPALIPIFCFFLLSGASGLVYEVIWTRTLLNVFGATLYAVSTVVAAFMGGLALGSIIGGRLADRCSRPLLIYGALEILIAISALLVAPALRLFDPIYHAVYSSGEASFLKLSLLRFVLSFMLLLIPTTSMGATLPLLSRFIVRRAKNRGSRIGLLYAANTTGAVVGAFLAGFYLLSHFGVQNTIFIAAAISTLVGISAIILSMTIESKLPKGWQNNLQENDTPEAKPNFQSEPPAPSWMVRTVLFTYAISGFTALAYQVLWTRTLIFRLEYLKNTTYCFSAILTVFLIGLALGSAFVSTWIDRQRTTVRLYGLIQMLTGLSAAFSFVMLIFYINNIPLPTPYDPVTDTFFWGRAVSNLFIKVAVTIGLPTFLMGMAFPVVARICVGHLKSIGSGIGRIYAFNTIGAIFGSFAAGFLIIPVFGLGRSLVVLGLVNATIGVVILLLNPNETKQHRKVFTGLSIAVILLLCLLLPMTHALHTLAPNHIFVPLAEEGKVAYKEGPLATIAVTEDSIGDRMISVDNASVAGTSPIMLTDQKSLAHIPMLLLEKPESVLTVGFGSGGASWSYLLYDELKQVDCIEICQTVPEMASLLKASNHGVLDEWDGSTLAGKKFHNGRYRVIIDDARSYLRFTDHTYDIIATDCTDLRYKSSANLYDVEYFTLCRQRISKEGMVVVWMPLAGMTPEVFACAMKTFLEVFPGEETTVWFMHNLPTHYLLLLGTNGKLSINVDNMLAKLARPKIHDDLAEIQLHQPEKILSCFLGSGTDFQGVFDSLTDKLNTENTPVLEFESPRYGYSSEPLRVNLELLRNNRTSVLPYLRNQEDKGELLVRLSRFEAAVDDILLGNAAYRQLKLIEACKHYMKAAQICPEDESIQSLMKFDEMTRTANAEKRIGIAKVLWAKTFLAELDLLKGNYQTAADTFNMIIQKSQELQTMVKAPLSPTQIDLVDRSLIGLAACYEGLKRYEKGLQYLDEISGLTDSKGTPYKNRDDYKEILKSLTDKAQK